MSTSRKIGLILALTKNQKIILEKLLEEGEISVNALWRKLKSSMSKDTFIKETKNLEKEGLILRKPYKNRIILTSLDVIKNAQKELEDLELVLTGRINQVKKGIAKEVGIVHSIIFTEIGYSLLKFEFMLPKGKIKEFVFSLHVNLLLKLLTYMWKTLEKKVGKRKTKEIWLNLEKQYAKSKYNVNFH